MAQRKKTTKKQDDVLIDLTEVTGQAEDFFQKYQKQIMIVAGTLVAVLGGYLGYTYLYKLPKQKEAVEQMAQAEWQFQRDSFNLALVNPGGGFPGFADIVKKYGGTDAANAALYYAGVSCLNMGQYDAAISYLEDYSASGKMLPIMKNGALGDAWSEKGDLEKALSYYDKAASNGDNEILTPYYLKKLAMLSEKQGNKEQALDAWKKIQEAYPTSPEMKDAEKHIILLGQ
ncbi:MAG: hypothetical protein RI973_594 [Bacteroidota bacterium]|jgi:tetratricopeptide (TPR) repeat protein